MWSTVESTKVWTDAFIQFFRDTINRKIAMNQSPETENIMIETEFGYIYGKVDFDEDTSILDTHEYLSNIKKENIGLENTLLAKPILKLDIDRDIFSDINTIVYFPFELQTLTIYGSKKSISKNSTKLVFLGNEFGPLVNKNSYVNFYYDYSFGYLDTLVILHKNNVFKKSSVVLKNNYIKNLCLTCNNFYISDNYIEYLQCSLEVFLDVSLYTIVEKIDVYAFTDVLSFGLKSSLDTFYKKAILCHSQVGEKSKNNAVLFNLFNQWPNTDKDIKYELLNEDTITYFICNENEFSDLEFYGDVFLEDYRDEIAQYMGINSHDIKLINSGLSFKYLNLINVNLVFKSQKKIKCLEEYRNMVRKKWENMSV